MMGHFSHVNIILQKRQLLCRPKKSAPPTAHRDAAGLQMMLIYV
jgi:hypothetical protein